MTALRVGVVGTESSHVDHIIDYLNVRGSRPGCRVVALAGGEESRNDELARLGGIDTVVGSADDLLSVADVLIVTTRHAGLHRQQAAPFLAEGRPVLVDKPLACSVADAEAILRTAREHGALVTSYSTLRHLPEMTQLVGGLPPLGPLRFIVATGPADEHSPYGGVFYYGIHPVDIALMLAPGELGGVSVHRVAESICAQTDVGDVHITVNLVAPGASKPVPFHALAVGREGLIASELPATGNYVAHGLNAFFDMVTEGAPRLSDAQLLRPVTFLEAVQSALDAPL